MKHLHYECARGHEHSSPRHLEKCIAAVHGRDCNLPLFRVGQGAGRGSTLALARARRELMGVTT